jgi:hypothetical protein
MLHCFLLRKTLVIKIDEKTTYEGLDPGVRGSLAEIICQESKRDDGFSIRVLYFVICRVQVASQTILGTLGKFLLRA